jgi:glycosyltransferase involved in cell wall biosynthesis
MDMHGRQPIPRQTAAHHRPVRVCFLIDRLQPGGTESQLLALIRTFDRARVEPYLCLLNGEDAVSRALEPPDCPVLRLRVRSLCRPQTIARAWQLGRFLRRERIDILQIYFPDSTYLGVPVGRLAGVPYILRTRNNLNHWMTPTHRFLGRLLNRLVTATVTNCEASRQAVLADERPAPESVLVLETGVELARFEGITPPNPAMVRRVGVVANLRPVKGLEVFTRAAALVGARHPEVVFEVAGEGEHRPALVEQAATLGLAGRFRLPGTVHDIPTFLATLEVAVLPSLAEGMSNAVLEYMAARRPIVATAVGGTTQLIDDGIHGLLVPPGDAAALARAICRLLEDRQLATRLANAARRRVENDYSREVRVRSLEAFYRNLVHQGRILVHDTQPHAALAHSG